MEIWSLKDQLGPGKQTAETFFTLEKEERQKNYHWQSLLTVPPLTYFIFNNFICPSKIIEILLYSASSKSCE
jgi:hypothetical protein